MPKFRYTAVDSRRQAVSGELEAVSTEEAIEKLSAQGLDLKSICLAEVSDVASGRPLSTEEAVELASQVAELAKSGLPLEAGLQALAEELPEGRLPQVLRAISKQLSAGMTLDAALEAQGSRFPKHVRGLIVAGVRSGRLPEVLEEFVDLQRDQTELRRRISLSLAYPTLLVTLLAALYIFFDLAVVGSFAEIYGDFEMNLPAMTEFVMATTGPGGWMLSGWAVFLIAAAFLLPMIPGPPGVCRFLYRVPLIGPLWRFSRLAQCSRLLAVLLQQQVPLPDALRLTASGLADAYLADGCRLVADDVESGRPLAESLAARSQFPPSMIPLIDWGERTPALADSFRASAEMFEGRVQSQGVFLETIMMPVVFFLTVMLVGMLITALFMPLIQLITALSG